VTEKYDRIIALSTYLIRLEIQKGSLRWKATELARCGRISRSRLYEILGKNKSDMRRNALVFLLEELYSLSPERIKFDQVNGRLAGLIRSRELVRYAPELLAFYFRNRDKKDELGGVIRSHEKRFLERISIDLKIVDPADLLFIRTMIHGISVAPFLNIEEVGLLANRMAEVAKMCFVRS
jgi:hypothetical protein